jgi:hypothetical protein
VNSLPNVKCVCKKKITIPVTVLIFNFLTKATTTTKQNTASVCGVKLKREGVN